MLLSRAPIFCSGPSSDITSVNKPAQSVKNDARPIHSIAKCGAIHLQSCGCYSAGIKNLDLEFPAAEFKHPPCARSKYSSTSSKLIPNKMAKNAASHSQSSLPAPTTTPSRQLKRALTNLAQAKAFPACRPCQKRKVKCSNTSDETGFPCDACKKRGTEGECVDHLAVAQQPLPAVSGPSRRSSRGGRAPVQYAEDDDGTLSQQPTHSEQEEESTRPQAATAAQAPVEASYSAPNAASGDQQHWNQVDLFRLMSFEQSLGEAANGPTARAVLNAMYQSLEERDYAAVVRFQQLLKKAIRTTHDGT